MKKIGAAIFCLFVVGALLLGKTQLAFDAPIEPYSLKKVVFDVPIDPYGKIAIVANRG
ncbi:hypothetical protein [Tumebacillus permanentifrigoris]|uniref:Uncharacterized protein n=1 Tax=Tumebacillus permanentifrigoris TaxID=378543 RepID=A0A316D6Y5_9BACL|nr:hypothetical protein [Tumebacillus permanentifrigoris]PWK05088.1 hypothetical protein C7459_12720 [Tumebacillus permanentifrigoris]